VFPLTIVGALVTASSDSYAGLIAGQVLTGIGCAPAFLACTVFIARRFPIEKYSAVNGAALGIGSVGLLLTGTPLAFVIETWSWRAGYVALAVCASFAWLAILLLVREESPARSRQLEVWGALRGYGELFRLPHTLGIIGLSLFTYASFLSLRGLWLGPLLIDRYGFSLVQTGNVALAVSVLGMFGPPLFGRLDPGDRTRRLWITGFTLACAGIFAAMALPIGAAAEVLLALAIGIVSGYMVMQYADVRASYPTHLTGRAMAVFTMAMFLGVALMQWLTGLAASAASALRIETYTAVFGAIAGLLVLGTACYRFLPGPRAGSGAAGEPSQSAP
jgi:predicted MFS family arabinose efflux permease